MSRKSFIINDSHKVILQKKMRKKYGAVHSFRELIGKINETCEKYQTEFNEIEM